MQGHESVTCVSTKTIQQREAGEAGARGEDPGAVSLPWREGMDLNELTRLQGVSEGRAVDCKGESQVAQVQTRRHLQQSDAQMLGGAGNSPRMTARTQDSGTVEETVALEGSRKQGNALSPGQHLSKHRA